MPEAAEVRLSVDYLTTSLVGRYISAMRTTTTGRYRRDLSRFWKIRDHKIEEIDAKGKFTWWKLTNENSLDPNDHVLYLHVTYGMTGNWQFIGATEDDPIHAAARIRFSISQGLPSAIPSVIWLTQLDAVFIDPRHMGTIKIASHSEHIRKLSSLGPDILKSPPNVQDFTHRLAKKGDRPICEALLDQGVVSGIGNYMKAEALFAAGVSPHRMISELTTQEIQMLRDGAHGIALASLYFGGASFRDHINVDGQLGKAHNHLQIYGKSHCPNGHQISRELTSDKRTTHWCRQCQR